MHDLGGLQNPQSCHWSDDFQKNQEVFFGKSCSRVSGAPGCNSSTLIDLTHTSLASRDLVEPI